MSETQTKMYRTRRDWLIVEILMGLLSISTGVAGIVQGELFLLYLLPSGFAPVLWVAMFTVTGSVLLLTSIGELIGRESPNITLTPRVLCYYAQCRMWWHFLNGLCWLYAFTSMLELYVEKDILIASILLQAGTLLGFNVWGVIEHAKAIWLDVERAGTHSLVRATLDRIRNSSGAV